MLQELGHVKVEVPRGHERLDKIRMRIAYFSAPA